MLNNCGSVILALVGALGLLDGYVSVRGGRFLGRFALELCKARLDRVVLVELAGAGRGAPE